MCFIAKEILIVHPRKPTLSVNLFAIVRDQYYLGRTVLELKTSDSRCVLNPGVCIVAIHLQ